MRSRFLGLCRRLLRALLPRRVDELLYEADRSIPAPENSCTLPAQIVRYTAGHLSGIPEIDRRLGPNRTCYAALVGEGVAHQSWLATDVQLPRLFGFDRRVPVIGDCSTRPEFRGQHLYPAVLRHIVTEVTSRGAAEKVYILVSPNNQPSIRGIERAGFRLRARLRGIRFGLFVWRLP